MLAACLDDSGYDAACLDHFISPKVNDDIVVLRGGWPSLPRHWDAAWNPADASYTYDYTYDPKFV